MIIIELKEILKSKQNISFINFECFSVSRDGKTDGQTETRLMKRLIKPTDIKPFKIVLNS